VPSLEEKVALSFSPEEKLAHRATFLPDKGWSDRQRLVGGRVHAAMRALPEDHGSHRPDAMHLVASGRGWSDRQRVVGGRVHAPNIGVPHRVAYPYPAPRRPSNVTALPHTGCMQRCARCAKTRAPTTSLLVRPPSYLHIHTSTSIFISTYLSIYLSIYIHMYIYIYM
jgi:hypothetical protein